jgi:hypothetical protein
VDGVLSTSTFMIEPNLDEVVRVTEQSGKLSHFVSNRNLLYFRIAQLVLMGGYKTYQIIVVSSEYLYYFTYVFQLNAVDMDV